MGNPLAISILRKVHYLLVVAISGVPHIDLVGLCGGDGSRPVGDDEVVDAFKEGPPFFEVVGVLGW